MAGEDRAGVAYFKAKRVAGPGLVEAGACVGFEDCFVAKGLGIAEVEEAVPAVRSVEAVVPAERL
jgi:hypothetical protein